MKQSNTYIFIYASVMVILVAAILSFTAIQLKPLQSKNIEVEKKLDILKSVNLEGDIKGADDKNTYVETLYSKYITSSYVINSEGNLQDGKNAFTINLKKELVKPLNERNLPIFVCTHDNGEENYIIPVLGKGLWGPIWGYVALEKDYNTIYGAVFAHKSETPGLGADIDKKWFQKQFIGKKLFDNNQKFTSIIVMKGGATPNSTNEVDAISGGTITSKALEEMVFNCLNSYEKYFKSKSN
jgi:Na+-transporting NADH:ubiquinone oxidoreductase subunit C